MPQKPSYFPRSPTISATLILGDSKMESPPRKRIQLCSPIVSVAAKALADKNIPVVEFGKQVKWRHGDPVVLTIVEWAVPDALLSLSSQTLTDYGFSRVPPSRRVTDTYAKWERASIIHMLHRACPIYLYPLSFIGLTLEDTVEVTTTFDHTIRIRTPKPPMYMVSLIRHLLDHPVGDRFRFRVECDLVSFISFYILRDKPLNMKDGESDADESEEDFQKRVEDAVREMKTWDWGADGNNYLCIAESIVRDCRSIELLSSC